MKFKKSKKKECLSKHTRRQNFDCQIITDDSKIVDCKKAIDSLEHRVSKRTAELTSIIDILNKEITAHKQARKTISKSEKRYEELFNSALEGICLLDESELIQYCNPAFAKILDEESISSLNQKSLLNYLPDSQKEFVLSQTVIRKNNISTQYELEIISAKGIKKLLYVSVSPKFDDEGQYHGAFGLVNDITKRKSDEIELIESEEKFRVLSDQSPNMIFINYLGKVVYVNRRCEEVMEYTREEFYAPEFDFRSIIAPESIDKINERFSKYRQGIESPPTEYTIITKSGKSINTILSTKLIPYNGNSAVLGIITDITKYKEAEKTLKALNLELEAKQSALIGKNIALKEILDLIEDDKKQIGVQIQANIDKTIMPILGRLKERANPEDKNNILLLQNSLKLVTQPFISKLESSFGQMTPREAEISNMIKIGLSTKEIALSLNTSWETVRNQRKQIRRKLNISGKKINLTSFLQSTE
ncbi:MAG: PAS domain S-box protein [candidate division Zixibacteria bacterium]|nr:PAS domain S-box protein [candidate division Zixibacteria bacterium]